MELICGMGVVFLGMIGIEKDPNSALAYRDKFLAPGS